MKSIARTGIRAAAAVAALAYGVWFEGRASAQSDSWTSPYPMVLTERRALALVEAADRNLNYVPGEVLIKFKDGVSPSGQQRALDALRSRPPVSALRWIDNVALFVDDRERDAAVLASQLQRQPEVEYAEPNYLYHRVTTPNDPSFSSRQWHFQAIGLPAAWDINNGADSSIIVAVVDYGVTEVDRNFVFPTWDGRAIRNITVPFSTNPDLRSARLVGGRDFAFWTGPVLDMDGHGTHVSATVGQDTNNGVAGAGVAYNAQIMPIKVCAGYWEVQFLLSSRGFRGFVPLNVGGCDQAAIAQGIRYAVDSGAHVINVSLGGASPPPLLVREALIYATQKGAFIALASGNDYDNGNPTMYPAAFAPSIDGVVAVGAVGPNLTHAYYSSAGSYVEIAAPGGDIRAGDGGGIWQATIFDRDFNPATIVFPRFDRYIDKALQGTSMASPHVAGIAALLVSQGVRHPAAVEAVIKQTARDLGTPGPDTLYGYGLIQPRTALFGMGITR